MECEQKIKFPCGYEIQTRFNTGILDFYIAKSESIPGECPIHGKNCNGGMRNESKRKSHGANKRPTKRISNK